MKDELDIISLINLSVRLSSFRVFGIWVISPFHEAFGIDRTGKVLYNKTERGDKATVMLS